MPTRRLAVLAALALSTSALADEKKPAPPTPAPETVACAKRVLGAARAVREADGARQDAVAAWKDLQAACGDCAPRLSSATPSATLACTTLASIDSEPAGTAAAAKAGLRGGAGTAVRCDDYGCISRKAGEFAKRTAQIRGCDDWGCD